MSAPKVCKAKSQNRTHITSESEKSCAAEPDDAMCTSDCTHTHE